MFGRKIHLRVAGAMAFAALAAAPSAHAQLAVEHDSTVVTEQAGNGNGIAEPGETLGVTESVISAEFDPLTGVTGHLTTTAAGVTTPGADAAWPDLDFGFPGSNLTPFSVALDAAGECGARVPLDVALSTSAGPTNVSFSIPTGAAGPFSASDAVDVPVAIPDNGTVDASLTVAGTGRVKGLRVRIGKITHSYDGDLRITIVAPDGKSAILSYGRGADGQNFVDTVFDDAAATSIRNGSAPFTGSFQPEQPLSSLDGAPLAGTWTLRVTDTTPGNIGGVEAWGVDAAPAVCQGATPPPPPAPQPQPAPAGFSHGSANAAAHRPSSPPGWQKKKAK